MLLYTAFCSYCEKALPTIKLKNIKGALVAIIDIENHECDVLERVKLKLGRLKIWKKKEGSEINPTTSTPEI